MELDSLYQEVILDHYRSPHHKGLSADKDIQVHHNNPSCGDEVTLNLSMKGGVVTDLTWDGVGCSISMASTSVMSDLLVGKDYKDAMNILGNFVELMQSKGQSAGDESVLEDAVAFAGVSKFPARIKCALLGWMAFKDASSQVMQ
ncbi:MAG TPA: SUF system NifU family Fe-S cluster assembly protein [Actinobacteria bacterium]|jgi:nitrogen fixation protein NifU and related proteins|nr:MAG: nitrogen fixation protein NifU [Actinobacteria bacterium BACL4 MAG-121001-bin59]HCP71863.1 SUF system NifU family Fe-S cluster assembly protein [Actinomycetota bacterium]